MSNPSDTTPMSPEEIRREMLRRFDELNAAASERHQQRRDSSDRTSAEENRRWVKPEADTATTK